MADTTDGAHWTTHLDRNDKGVPYSNEYNIGVALRECPLLRDRFDYEEFCDALYVVKPLPGMGGDLVDEWLQDWPPRAWADEFDVKIQRFLQHAGLSRCGDAAVHRAVVEYAKEHCRRNVLTAELDFCHRDWDGIERLSTWLTVYLGATGPADYLREIGKRFLISAVARAFSPGCKADHVLVLEGAQGKGKSAVVEILGLGYSRDMTNDFSTKDAADHIQGVWIAELGELSSLRRTVIDQTKAFLSRRIDRYRPAYGRTTIDRPRRTVFIGTTDSVTYLNDPAGARRFWPVDCGHIDLDALREDVRLLWAEAVELYRRAHPWHLDDVLLIEAAKTEQALRYASTPQELLVLEYADRQLAAGIREIDMLEVLATVFDIDARKQPALAGSNAFHVERALSRDGWVKQRTKRRCLFSRPPPTPSVPMLPSSTFSVNHTPPPPPPPSEDLSSGSDPESDEWGGV
jgi:hypothetical protein